MPRRADLKKILVVGSGPIVIGQGCEFDYSGTQGAKALGAEGYEVVLVNSNPATIMTDPELAARTYIEPLEKETLKRILLRERPDALLPTLGGQTALNLALALADDGILSELGVELIGASAAAIRCAEDRGLFKEALARIGLACPRSGRARSLDDARRIAAELGYPLVLRPSFTLGGTGGAIVFAEAELEAKVLFALAASPTGDVLVEESVLGWKEFELEVIRDGADNFIVVCAIENVDPMGVHTGDSITVAPPMTLTDREYQRLRDASRAIMTEVGVETGGSNVQFAVDPKTGRFLVIEMNPRVSRSSALASKATGYPIAKIAAKLAVGFRLDELTNDITGTSAAFEPVLDYVVVKWPRFAFEKFPETDDRLGTQMKSVGEVMAIGRTFPEALQKAARSLETRRDGLVSLFGALDYIALAKARRPDLSWEGDDVTLRTETLPANPFSLSHDLPVQTQLLKDALRVLVAIPTAERLFFVADAMRHPVGMSDGELHELTGIDPWFLAQVRRIIEFERRGCDTPEDLRDGKRLGFSDAELGGAEYVRAWRASLGMRATFARVDTCAAELRAETPYLYSTYGDECEARPSDRTKVIILGGGPNRIGQGIEFDYCCVHACFALREQGLETIMINCNPETVSTDYDTADRLYFEPLTFEHVMAICEAEQRSGKLAGVIVQLGGQTPLKLALPLSRAGIPLLGTSADAIDRAEDRGRFDALLEKLGLVRPRGATAYGVDDALEIARRIGFPVLVRPSYVLGGRAMSICRTEGDLLEYARLALGAAENGGAASVLVDALIEDAIEVDVDCVADGSRVVIGGVIQHIEEAGIHSGDSAGVLPPYSLSEEIVRELEEQSRRIALELGVIGLMNVQFAVHAASGTIYVLEVNPRASRTIPFVSKATGVPLAKLAAKVMAGATLDALGARDVPRPQHLSIKESVFPFAKFPGTDTLLGPEMKSTGEVMGIASRLGPAFGKTLLACGYSIPLRGTAFLSVRDEDKELACAIARRLAALGFGLLATNGTAAALARAGLAVAAVNKVQDGSPHVVEAIRAGEVALVFNTAAGKGGEKRASFALRRATLAANIPYFTTMSAAAVALLALEDAARSGDAAFTADIMSLQERHGSCVRP